MKSLIRIGLVNTTQNLDGQISKIIDTCPNSEIVFHAEKITDLNLYLNKHKPTLLIVYSDFPKKGNLQKLLAINVDIDILMILKSEKITFFPTQYLTLDMISVFEISSKLSLMLECISNGLSVYGSKIKSSLKKHRAGFSSPSDVGVSERECEVLNSWLPTMNYSKVANELDISINTVRSHMNNIAKKMGVKNKNEIVGFLSKNHWYVFETGQVFFI